MKKNYFHYESKHGDIQFAANYTGLSTSSIYKRVAREEIPYHRIPGSSKLIFYATDLERWIKGEQP